MEKKGTIYLTNHYCWIPKKWRIIQYGNENDEIIMWKLYSYNEIKDIANRKSA